MKKCTVRFYIKLALGPQKWLVRDLVKFVPALLTKKKQISPNRVQAIIEGPALSTASVQSRHYNQCCPE